jgi:hypothetical protein
VATLARLLAALDDDSLRRGKQFERVCEWFLTNDPIYRHPLRRVWLWQEWPGRWGADSGIDLVAEDTAGASWAIQTKAYDPSYSVTKADVDTFLSESARPQFSFRLLIATTNRVGQTARRSMAGQEKPARLLLQADLEASQVEWPSRPSDLRAKPSAPKRPRPHQREAVKAVVKGFETADRGQLIILRDGQDPDRPVYRRGPRRQTDPGVVAVAVVAGEDAQGVGGERIEAVRLPARLLGRDGDGRRRRYRNRPPTSGSRSPPTLRTSRGSCVARPGDS